MLMRIDYKFYYTKDICVDKVALYDDASMDEKTVRELVATEEYSDGVIFMSKEQFESVFSSKIGKTKK